MAERWTGVRVKPLEAQALSGISDIRRNTAFETDLRRLLTSGHYGKVYLDLFRLSAQDPDTPAHRLSRYLQRDFPFVSIGNADAILRKLRLIKQPNEIAALRQAEKITEAGSLAMMRSSRPGKYEYQYKADFDYALGQFGPQGPGFPSIISAAIPRTMEDIEAVMR